MAIFLILGVQGALADGMDPSRSDLKDLKPSESVSIKEYVEPYLITETAYLSKIGTEVLTERVRKHLRNSALTPSGHYSKTGASSKQVTEATVPLPKGVVTGDQLEGIQECKAEYCKMKLNTKKEKTLVEKAKDKVGTYHEIILDRVRAYLDTYELRGYEDVWNNKSAVRKMLKTLSFMKQDYPKCGFFLYEVFYEKPKLECQPKDSFLRSEVVELNLNQLQPVLRISEVFEFQEKERALFFEIHIYTNHYFDSSARVYEVVPHKSGKAALILTDIMDVDTLKLSSVARLLYKNQMHKAVADFQKQEAKTILQ